MYFGCIRYFQCVLVGGLGDVAGSLPKALARRGHRVMVRQSFSVSEKNLDIAYEIYSVFSVTKLRSMFRRSVIKEEFLSGHKSL